MPYDAAVEMTAELPPDGAAPSIELVRRAQGGDREALERLIERYYPRVLRVVRLRLGRRLRGHLESVDILQDTFAAAVKEFDRFEMREDASLIHWLGKIAEHKIRGRIDYHGAEKRLDGRTVPLEVTTGTGSDAAFQCDPADDTRAPLERLLHGEDIERIETCLDELREDHREVIIHRYFEGADWRAVADWMGLPGPDAARMRCVRAVFELERLYRRHGGAAESSEA
jgi:RNA polymerase sigma-70 factor (ECF subfamily)